MFEMDNDEQWEGLGRHSPGKDPLVGAVVGWKGGLGVSTFTRKGRGTNVGGKQERGKGHRSRLGGFV